MVRLVAILLVVLVGCDEPALLDRRNVLPPVRASPSTTAITSSTAAPPVGSQVSPPEDAVRACELALRASHFDPFARLFARCWDSKVAALIEPLVVEKEFWLIYNVGVAPRAYRFRSVSEVLTSENHGFGFGYLGANVFDCSLSWGADPGMTNCTGEDRTSTCELGVAALDLVKVEDRQFKYHEGGADQRLHAQLRARALVAQRRITHFMTDDDWGGVFYFGKVGGRWKLIAVSTVDCSI